MKNDAWTEAALLVALPLGAVWCFWHGYGLTALILMAAAFGFIVGGHIWARREVRRKQEKLHEAAKSRRPDSWLAAASAPRRPRSGSRAPGGSNVGAQEVAAWPMKLRDSASAGDPIHDAGADEIGACPAESTALGGVSRLARRARAPARQAGRSGQGTQADLRRTGPVACTMPG
jgi:hypothetical protein